MEQQGVISRVDDPTEWCAPMVVVPKADGKVRICVDLTKLNESVQRERHILPSVEQTLGQLAGGQVFSKLDANSEFWQIPLSKKSSLLTTFIPPFGRFCFNRLPFGITSAPEHFQKRMSAILAGIDGVVCMVDDILEVAALKNNMISDWMQHYSEFRRQGPPSMSTSVSSLNLQLIFWAIS